jgi:hypothetical protein
MAWAWEQALPPAEKLVLLKLADNAHDDGGSARPGVAYLAAKTNQSESTVHRALASLVQRRLIRPTASGGGRGHPTEYQLSLSEPVDNSPVKGVNLTGFMEERVSPEPIKGVTDEAKGCHDDPVKGVKSEVPRVRSSYEPRTEPRTEPRSPERTFPHSPDPQQGRTPGVAVARLPVWSEDRRRFLESLASVKQATPKIVGGIPPQLAQLRAALEKTAQALDTAGGRSSF